jgi:hypothetical protein
MPELPFDDLARDLRQGPGDELRREAAADEALTELQRRRRASLSEVARAAMHRGDGTVVQVAGLVLSHPLVAVGKDYVVMTTADGTIDVLLEAAVLTIEPRPSGGRSGVAEAATWRARLAEHEQHDTEVELVTTAGVRVAGVIEVAASDHLAVRTTDGTVSHVATASVAAVISRRPPGWR